MEKKNIDWSNFGFGYVQDRQKICMQTLKMVAWDEGALTEDANIVIERVCRCSPVCSDSISKD